MSKKLIALTVLLGVVLLSLLGYYFILQTNPEVATTITTGFKNFFPFGDGDNVEVATSTENGGEDSEIPLSPVVDFEVKLRQISREPVAGAGTLDVKIGTSTKPVRMGTVVRYIEKATGHIFETELFSINQNRISNTTIPTAYDAIWGNKNASLIARYLSNNDQTVDTYSLTVKNTSTTTQNVISGIAFPANIDDISVLGTSIFYLVKNTDSSSGYISNWSGTAKKQVWSSPIRDLVAQFVNTNTVTLTTKPAQNLPGFMYFVNTNSGAVRKILGDIPGLSTNTNPDTTKVVYISQGSGVSMYTMDIGTKKVLQVTPSTFPEKCVWSKKDKNVIYCAVPKEFIEGTGLTYWYKGMMSTTDDIWKYNITNNTAIMILDLLNESNEQIDVIKPLLSENEQYLVFLNKRDNTLWSLDLNK